MEENSIKIGCPVCGAVLKVKNQIGIESKNVTCPVCKKMSPFVSFKRIGIDTDDHTQYPDMEHGAEPPTEVSSGSNDTLGRLCVVGSSLSFPLRLGRNLIGRKASGSGAHVQIPCTSKRMSRDHLVIEVKKVAGSGLVHYVWLNKEQVNPTYVGNNLLEYGDKIVLESNNIIRLPDVEIRFEIPDGEGTELVIK